MATGALYTALSVAGVESRHALVDKPGRQGATGLDRLPIPPSEAILGAFVMPAGLTLASAVVTLIAPG